MRKMFLILFLVFLMSGCDFIGGGDTIVKGNDNLLVEDEIVDRVAAALAQYETTPKVTDEELRVLYEVIRENALAGDLRASLVMLKVAGIQRAPEEEEEEAEQ